MTTKSEWKSKKDQWIADTQMFQRIAKVVESTTDELAAAWESMKNNKVRMRSADSIKTHRIIQDAAIKAGKSRLN